MPQSRRLLLLFLTALLGISGIVWAAPPAQQVENIASFTTALRADLETLADAQLGTGNRPDNWTSNIDGTTPTYISDLWFDSELLANVVFGVNTRPRGWLGVTVDRAEVIARNTRIDVELTADDVYGFDVRPPSWVGATPLYRCDRIIINIYAILADYLRFSSAIDEGEVGYCVLLERELRDFILIDQALEPVEPEVTDLILAVRGDLERLANEVYGVNNRPQGWVANTDINSPLLITDNYADINTLANDRLGQGNRPDTWVGLITENRTETWRNQRHDLELLANALTAQYGANFEGNRPRGWQDPDPLRACAIEVQDLVAVLEFQFPFLPEDPEQISFDHYNYVGVEEGTDETYCQLLERQSNLFAEAPPLTVEERRVGVAALTFTYEADFSFAYLDVTALEYMGVIPRGTPFRAWYRNYAPSSMMFISGEDFAIYIDRRWTSMPQDVFDRLPTLQGVAPLTFCDALWCNGPGPTPTPTGGALESVFLIATPRVEPTVDPGTILPLDQKVQVNFENVRATYIQDNIQTRTAQVTLELCDTGLVNCEPVINVLDGATNAAKPVISQTNGLNVYEFPYGYTANLIIESATRVSRDLYLSDPTVLR
ncbi:MAG: hypothetical protein ACOYL5_08940 [Phototrophicaceae bacterium]|jgi:hypothetical protein